ncbi:MAG: hypothetical protein IPJ78_03950 [Gemmatimonadetes bacterium]|nr:hypothetical protein [Gemmatimonadota bacterium]
MRHLAGVVIALALVTLSCVLEAQQAPAPRAMICDSVGRSIPYATVQSSGSTPRVANDSGVVLLSVPRADSLKLLVRRIGFQAWEGWVRPDAAGDFVVRLIPLPQNLERVSIYERDTPLARTGFYDRMERVAKVRSSRASGHPRRSTCGTRTGPRCSSKARPSSASDR